MNSLFFVVLSLSLSGTLLALLLLLLQPLTKKRLSYSWQYYIWVLVLLRFLLPISPQISIVGELAHSLEHTAAVEAVFKQSPAAPGLTDELDLENQWEPVREQSWEGQQSDRENAFSQLQGKEAESSSGTLGAFHYIGVIWLGIALVMISYKAATYRSFERFAKAGAIEIKEGKLYNLFQDELALGNIKRTVSLYQNDLVSSPMLVGLRHPTVILPPLDADDDELRHILRHELTHHKRLDYLYKWLAQLVLCLHWFNPLVHVVVRHINKACELSCDEAVVKRLDAGGRVSYGNALMASLKAQGGYNSSVASMTMSENANIIKERLDAILSHRRNTLPVRITGIAVTAMLFCGFVFTGAYTAAPKDSAFTVENTTTAVNNPDGEGSRISKGTSRMPENIKTVTERARSPLMQHANIVISIDDDAAVDMVPTSAGEISVDYGEGLYQVSMENQGEDWLVHISYVGNYSVYPAATLYLPDIVYGNVDIQAEEATVYFSGVFQQGAAINANMESCSVFYTIPKDFSGTMNMSLPSCYIEIYSEDGYQSCDVTIANCMAFGNIADGFSKQGNSLVYSSDTGNGVVYIDMQHGGYASVESGSYRSPTSALSTDSTMSNDLTLVVQEYSTDQLREQNIWGVKVNAASEDILVSTGGESLKLQYYQASSDDYTVGKVSDRGGLIQEIYLYRNPPAPADESRRKIYVTIPESFDCDTLIISTANGNISLSNCAADTVLLETQSGQISVEGGVVGSYFSANSTTGNMDITRVALPQGEFSNHIQTESGAVQLRLPGPSSAYSYKIDAGSAAKIQIGGEPYSGGSAFTVNSGAAMGTIKFTSETGQLMVLDE